MGDNEESGKKDSLIGSFVNKTMNSATGSLAESASSLASGAFEQATKAAYDVTISVCKRNLDRMAAQQSIVNTRDVRKSGNLSVSMSPAIVGMVEACSLTLGSSTNMSGQGCVWVVCAPPDQGKTHAAEYLIHGNHSLRPKRSLKIDATNMTNFPKDCAEKLLNCGAAADSLSLLLCGALEGTADTAGDLSFAAKATSLAGKVACQPELTTPFDTLIEMHDADQHHILRLGEGMVPAPVLIIDEFYCDTKENQDFIRVLLRDASSANVVVFLMTTNKDWATKLIGLNGGTKVKPLPCNVDNVGYDGSLRFTEAPLWNTLSWTVPQLRALVAPFCKEIGLDREAVVPSDAKYSPSEAFKRARKLRGEKKMEELIGKK
jgi:hypothetical protein